MIRLFVLILAFHSTAYGLRLIRDTELENTMRLYARPLVRAAGLQQDAMHIFLLHNPSINAFSLGGLNIFVQTGLLTAADTPGEVMGVLAHEIGHVEEGHGVRLADSQRKAAVAGVLTALLSLPAAALSGNPNLALAGIMIGLNTSHNIVLKHQRSMESAADQAALDYLDKAHLSSKGLLRFMKKIKKREVVYQGPSSAYMRTHPLTKDRIAFIQHHWETSPYKSKKLPPTYMEAQKRVHAKLIGYLRPLKDVLNTYPLTLHTPEALYARAIAYMRAGQKRLALASISALLKRSPQDPFYLETKGDILKNAGLLQEALVPYKKALTLIPWAPLVRQSLAEALLGLNTPELVPEAVTQLKKAMLYEPWSRPLWRLLVIAYGRQKDRPRTYFAQAEYFFLGGHMNEAHVYVKRALKTLPKTSPEWLKARDLSALLSQRTS